MHRITGSENRTETDETLGWRRAVELAAMLRRREISSEELTRYFIDRIERLDHAINAIVVRDFDQALEAARRADLELARGDTTRALLGLPITIKESFDVSGLPTTWGSPHHRTNIAARDSEVTKRYRIAGAHLLGKSNVPFMLRDFQTDNVLFGRTRNPWDTARTCGGSSGGGAAAVAAGLTALDHGSDLGGSVRNPAHFCGVYSHKPTWDIVPMQGTTVPDVHSLPDMGVVGPIARSAEDLRLALGVVAGAEPLRAPAWRLELPPPRHTSLRGLRVALWPNDAVSPVDAEIRERVQHLADVLTRSGAVVSDRARPAFDPAAYRQAYVALVNSLIGANVSDDEYEQNKLRAAEFDPTDTSKPAAVARTLVLDHRAWLNYHSQRMRLRECWRRFFDDWDVLVCPIMATTAFEHDDRPMMERVVMVDGAPRPYFEQVFWASLATLAYLPATAFPIHPAKQGLPIGLQAIGPDFADYTTIEFTRLVAEEIGGFRGPIGFADLPGVARVAETATH
jgi:amidase